MLLGDVEQATQQQSTERHHSIIDWLSRETSGLVRQSNDIHKYSSSWNYPIINNKQRITLTFDTC